MKSVVFVLRFLGIFVTRNFPLIAFHSEVIARSLEGLSLFCQFYKFIFFYLLSYPCVFFYLTQSNLLCLFLPGLATSDDRGISQDGPT